MKSFQNITGRDACATKMKTIQIKSRRHGQGNRRRVQGVAIDLDRGLVEVGQEERVIATGDAQFDLAAREEGMIDGERAEHDQVWRLGTVRRVLERAARDELDLAVGKSLLDL